MNNTQSQVININFMPADFQNLSSDDKITVLKAMEISIEKKISANTTAGTALTAQLTAIQNEVVSLQTPSKTA